MIYFAFWGNSMRIAKLLLEYGADINVKVYGYDLFHDAVRCGDVGAVKLFLELGNGFDSNARSIDGDTAHEIAIKLGYGHIAMMIAFKKM